MSHAERKMLRRIHPSECRVTGHAFGYDARPRPGERCACGTIVKCDACGAVHVEVLVCRVCAAYRRKERRASQA